MAIKIAFANFKGGSGKTISSIATASILASKGYEVLFVDCDKQGYASERLKACADGPNIYDIFFDGCTARECIQEAEYVDIISCGGTFFGIDDKVSCGPESHYYLKKALASVEDEYDFVIFDTPPYEDILFVNAIMATDYVLIPFDTSTISCLSIKNTCEVIEEYQRENVNLKIVGAFGFKDFERDKQYDEMVKNISKNIPILPSVILDMEDNRFLDEGKRVMAGSNETNIERKSNKLINEILEEIE